MNVRRPALLVAIATAIAIVGSTLTPLAASAVTYGTVSGIVTLSSGAAAKGVTVQAVQLSNYDKQPLALDPDLRVSTSSTGAFTITGVASSEYTLQFTGATGHFMQYLGGSVTIGGANTFIVLGSKDTYVRAALEASATLAVTVKDLAGKAIPSASVSAFSRDDFGDWKLRATGTTSKKGVYTFTGLNADEYRLRAWSPTGAIASVYSGGWDRLEWAENVVVAAGVPATYGFSVPTTGVISGTIAGSHDGVTVPTLAGVGVRLFRVAGGVGVPTDYATVSTSKGAYSFPAVTPGAYTLRFTPPRTKNGAPLDPAYGETFLGDTNTAFLATQVTVVAGQKTAIGTTTLAEGATLTGRVLWGGNPQAGVPVYVYTASTVPALSLLPGVESAITDADGRYSIRGLGGGTWHLRIASGAERVQSAEGYLDYWKPAHSERTLVSGETLTVADHELEQLLPTDEPTVTSYPTISGNEWVGQELTAHSATFTPTLASGGGAFVWLRDGVAISGAIGTNYSLTGADVGRRISVRQTFTMVDRNSHEYTSAQTGTIFEAGGPSFSVGPSMVGSLKVDATVTANPGEWNLPGLSFTYKWCDYTGAPVFCTPLGVGKEFTPAGSLLGRPIALETTTHRLGYGSTRTMLGVGTVGSTTFSQVTAPKVTKAGSVYTLSPGTWSSAVTSVNPTWQYFDVASGTWLDAGSSLSLNASPLAGKRIRVVAQITGTGVAPFTFAVNAQTGVGSPPTGSLTLNTNYTVPETAYAPAATFPSDPEGDETEGTYQWQYKKGSKWVDLAGEFGYALELGDSLAGKNIRLVIAAKSEGFTTVTYTTPPAYVQPRTAPALSNPVSVAGTIAVGRTLTNTTPAAWSVAGVTTTYAWGYYSNGWKRIPGATKSTYKVAEAYYGLTISAIVTGTKKGYQSSVTELSLGPVGAGTLTQKKPGVIVKKGSKWVITAPTMTQGATTNIYQWSYYNDDENARYYLDSGPGITSKLVSETEGYTPVVDVLHSRPHFANYFSTTVGPTQASLAVVTEGSIQLSEGDVRVGLQLSATNGSFSPATPTRTYQWYSGSGTKYTAIAGATSQTFTPTAAQLGKQIRVKVTGTVLGAASASFTATTLTNVSAGAGPSVVTATSITGTPKVGSALTGVKATFAGSGYSYSYAWYRGAGTTPIAKTANYTPTGLDLGQALKLTVTASKTGYLSATSSATTAAVAQGTLSLRKDPVVTAKGTKLTVTAGTWSVASISTEVQWTVVDRNTGVATTHTGAVGQAFNAAPYPGAAITVTVGAEALGYAPKTTTKIARLGRAAAWVGSDQPETAPTYFGGAEMGLDANWDLAADSTRYIWKRNGKTIADANTASYYYGFTDADIGTIISVTVTRITGGYATGTKTFTMDGTVTASIGSPSVAPATEATAVVGTKLTVAPGAWAVSGLAFSYQWFYLVNGAEVKIPGATASSFTPTPELAGNLLFARVKASKANYHSITIDTRKVSVDVGAAATATAPASLAQTGEDTLTASLGTVTPGFTVTVQWYRNGSASFGETGRTYIWSELGLGNTHAVFTARRPGYATTTFTSEDFVLD
jgi:hypothetical protein